MGVDFARPDIVGIVRFNTLATTWTCYKESVVKFPIFAILSIFSTVAFK